MKITIPHLSTSNALSFCQKLPYTEFDETYIFDVSEINNYEPLPMLLTAAAIRQFCSARAIEPWQIQLFYNDDTNYQYACHMGFFQAAGFAEGKAPGEAPGSGTYIPLTRLNIKELLRKEIEAGNIIEQDDMIENESNRLSHILSQDQKEFQKILQYLIREAVRNIPEHAEIDDVWICGQYWHNRDLAEIAILDEGVGIYNSLTKNAIHRQFISTNEDALRWALKPGVSVSFDPAKGQKARDVWANSGYGLYMISEICKMTGGWLTFVSGDDCLRVYSNGLSVCGVHFYGTALGIRVKPSKIVGFGSLIEAARKKGEETAKGIKNAFQEASVPSKGLIY